MDNNIIKEPLYISEIYTEYLSLINRYHNVKRPSVFVRYLNINKSESVFDKDLSSKYKRFSSNGVKYDIYDHTHVYYASSVVNDITEDNTYAGEHFTGSLSITTYTILEPQIDDIVVFPYAPLNTNREIWRVNNIRSVINAMYANVSVRWFELSLDYAPITSIEGLNFSKHFSYLLSEEKNVDIEKYKLLIKYLQKLEPILNQFNKQFNHRLELYPFNGKFPLLPNFKIYNLLCQQNNYYRYFENVLVPYGVLNYLNQDLTNKCIEIVDKVKHKINVIDYDFNYNVDHITNILTFNGDVNVFTISRLLELFQSFIDEIRKT